MMEITANQQEWVDLFIALAKKMEDLEESKRYWEAIDTENLSSWEKERMSWWTTPQE
tara:strand:- start:558 stop:728 length:171 start_codon:yes stop_codon:yes gene_type:complete